MGRVVELRDPYTKGHEERVAKLASAIAEEMGLPSDEKDAVEIAALVHDIGKLSVPIEILNSPGRLTDIEFEIVKAHSKAGYEILKDIEFMWPIADIVLQHHERMDGSGYPAGIAGEGILVPARILAVADVVEAMASHRPYRPAIGVEAAIEEIRANPDKFDPAASEACLRLHARGELGL
jgi:putative nucleotidyltransferase with HDIG domain